MNRNGIRQRRRQFGGIKKPSGSPKRKNRRPTRLPVSDRSRTRNRNKHWKKITIPRPTETHAHAHL